MMYQDGSVDKNMNYQDICNDKYVVSIAYGYSDEIVNNSMVVWTSHYHKSGHGDLVGVYPSIPYDYEIINPFLVQHNIIVNWIDCNYTWDTFDNKTGNWSGVIGEVSIQNANQSR